MFLVPMVVLWLLPLHASDNAVKKEEAIKKIEQAVAKTNIFELPSFVMKADVQIASQGKIEDGTYQLLWNGPDQWREDIRFPNYTEVQVGGKGTVWIQRSTDFYPLLIYELHSALGFGSGEASSGYPSGSLVQSVLTPKDTIKKVRERKEHGEKQTCIEFEDEAKRSAETCVNENTNTLVRGPWYVEKDIQPVGGGRVYPRLLAFVEDGKTVAKVSVTEFTAPVQFQANSFTPPAGVSPSAGCMNPAPFRLTKWIMPQYPQTAREQHVQGLVALDMWVGLNGIPRIRKVVAHASSDLEQSTVSTIQEWRYEPATCNGKPVEIETVMWVNYTLRP
jgi:TonB family protein